MTRPILGHLGVSRRTSAACRVVALSVHSEQSGLGRY